MDRDFSVDHRVVRWFWDWGESLKERSRRRLLLFWSGSSRVPPFGFHDDTLNEDHRWAIDRGTCTDVCPQVSTWWVAIVLPTLRHFVHGMTCLACIHVRLYSLLIASNMDHDEFIFICIGSNLCMLVLVIRREDGRELYLSSIIATLSEARVPMQEHQDPTSMDGHVLEGFMTGSYPGTFPDQDVVLSLRDKVETTNG